MNTHSSNYGSEPRQSLHKRASSIFDEMRRVANSARTPLPQNQSLANIPDADPDKIRIGRSSLPPGDRE